MAYSKLFSSIVQSSIWTEADSTRLLFITLLAIADRNGVVYGSKNGIGRIANIEPDDIEEGFERLMSPDTDSGDLTRNPANEGRRIEAIPGGFRLLNYEYYRAIRNEDDRREQNREAQERHRQRRKPASATVSHDKPISEAEAEAEADTEAEPKTPSRRFAPPTREQVEAEFASKERPDLAQGFWEWWGPDGLNWDKTKNWKMRVNAWIAKHPPTKGDRHGLTNTEARNLAYARIGRGD